MPGTLLKVAATAAAGKDSTLAKVADYAPRTPTNVGNTERAISLGVGGALLAHAIRGESLKLLSGLAGGYLLYRAATGHCPGRHMFMPSGSNGSGPVTAVPANSGVKVEHGVTVNAPVAEVYAFWRKFSRLPEFMDHLISVEETDKTHSTWTAKGPAGITVRWDAEVVTDTPNKVIAWRSLPNSDVDTAGSVHFADAPGGRGTEVRVSLKFAPPGGKLGSLVARLFGENPDQTVRADLHRFKSIMEVGEVARVEGQPHGRR